MRKAKSYKSNVKEAIHETASDLYEAGLIDKQTIRRFDASCLTLNHQLELFLEPRNEAAGREKSFDKRHYLTK